MLQKMRDQTQSLVFKVLVGIIVVVLAIFGFGAFNLFVTGDPEVASVNGEGITQNELAVATERERRRIAAQMGGEIDPSLIDPVQLQGAVLDRLVARAVLAQAAEDLGVAVSREQIDRELVENPAFQVDGKFQPNLYRQAVQTMGYTPQGFMDDTAELMALQQLQSALMNSALLTDRELNVHARLLAQRRDVAYLAFTADAFRDQVEVTDEEVRLRYEENQRAYTTEEAVDAAYVILSADDLMDDPAVEVAEADVRAAYEQEREAAPAQEERRSRHILLETGDARSPEAARQALEDVRVRIEGGESFADLARELSEDPGSAAQGGELGFAGRGVFDPAFEEALFALEESGQISAPVQTDYGYHLIQLEEIRINEYPSFEQARGEIEQRLRRDQADVLYQERLRELDNLAFEQPESLQGIVDAMGLTRQTAEGVTRDQGPAPFDAPDVRQRLFGSEVLEQGFNSPAVELGPDRAVVMRVTERHPPEQIPFEEVAEQIRSEIETERARALAREAHAAAQAQLAAGEGAAEVASAHGLEWRTFEAARRSQAGVPRPVLDAAFALPRPGDTGKSIGDAVLPDGGLALVTVTRVQDADVAALPEAELDGMRRFLGNRVAQLEFGGFFESLREEASIRRAD